VTKTCRVCGSPLHTKKQNSNFSGELQIDNFLISNSDYGKVLDLYQCTSCGFLQCHPSENVIAFYRKLIDRDYEDSRKARFLQGRQLLKKIVRSLQDSAQGKSLLDVGAGSGVFVEAAIGMKMRAVGVEPSTWLTLKAREKNLPVHCGELPISELNGSRFDIVSLIDVIEHVECPHDLLQACTRYLEHDGILAIVTPDVSSFTARLMKSRWWHYRIAHINYYTPKTLSQTIEAAGFHVEHWYRPGWYFSLDYLVERVNKYLPRIMHVPRFSWMGRIIIPLNLYDSLLVIARRSEGDTSAQMGAKESIAK
jgi:2-polyprenyl-3-methyl-5-hydroxy-6-metoxy-1,4-benzoquinol methylase